MERGGREMRTKNKIFGWLHFGIHGFDELTMTGLCHPEPVEGWIPAGVLPHT
jgi:hypothetical protein